MARPLGKLVRPLGTQVRLVSFWNASEDQQGSCCHVRFYLHERGPRALVISEGWVGAQAARMEPCLRLFLGLLILRSSEEAEE